MKYLNRILLCLSLLFTSNIFALEQKYHESVLPVIAAFKTQDKTAIAAFKTQDKTAIAAHIRYP